MLLGPSPVERAEYHFYAALALSGICRNAMMFNPTGRPMHREALTAHHQQLQIWAEHCPENFENRAALVAAELARLEGRDLDAERLYEQAIRSARANGFVHNEALACETAARFYAARGFEVIAEMFLERARDGYLRWGADGKVRQLDARYPQLVMADLRGGKKRRNVAGSTARRRRRCEGVTGAVQRNAAAPLDRAAHDYRLAKCGRRSWLADLATRE